MKFGTSGLRGLVADLQGHASTLYATAFAEHLLRNGQCKPGDPIFVGEDFRPSSPDIAQSCIGAFQRAGLRPLSCGALPTPALALYAMSTRCASVMITGSHIPADRNGIKFYRPDGEIDKSDEHAITQFAKEINIFDLTPGFAPSAALEANAMFEARIRSILPANALFGLKIGVYQHSTVARDLLTDALRHYGAQVYELGRSETFVPVDTEAVSVDDLERLKHWAREHGFDAIVSADGDGDRPLVTDERGEPVRGDLLGLLVAQFLKADCVVTPVTSNSGIERAGSLNTIRTRIGSPYVIAGMETAASHGAKAIIGFEANGGVLTGSDFSVAGGLLTSLPTRDCFLPILAVLYRRASEKLPLSTLCARSDLPFAASDRIPDFPTEASGALMAHLTACEKNLVEWMKPFGSIHNLDRMDGLRIHLDGHRILHLRPSGNAPEMRCYVEAPDKHVAHALMRQGLDAIKNWAAANGY